MLRIKRSESAWEDLYGKGSWSQNFFTLFFTFIIVWLPVEKKSDSLNTYQCKFSPLKPPIFKEQGSRAIFVNKKIPEKRLLEELYFDNEEHLLFIPHLFDDFLLADLIYGILV
jgi:hypothetical protein